MVQGGGPSLLGRDWFYKLRLKLGKLNVFHTQTASSGLQNVLTKHSELFKDKGVKVKLYVASDSKPRFFKPRPVPYALRGKVEAELQRLQNQGIIEPVQFSDWAAPIVPIVKHDGTVRICGDYKVTVNGATNAESYPLPRVEDLLASIGNGKVFSKLDVANAYQQLELEEDSKKYVTISTHKGLFKYNRLPFGVSTAPAVFQRTMESLLQGIPHVCVYMDDVLVSGESEAEHLEALDAVLTRLQQAGFRLKLAKCAFMLPSLEYTISADGVQPTQEKKRAILGAPSPQNVTQLKSFLGMLAYYSKFLPDLATTLALLNALLKKYGYWHWGEPQEASFKKAKELLAPASVLVHFDPKRKLLLACDASPLPHTG